MAILHKSFVCVSCKMWNPNMHCNMKPEPWSDCDYGRKSPGAEMPAYAVAASLSQQCKSLSNETIICSNHTPTSPSLCDTEIHRIWKHFLLQTCFLISRAAVLHAGGVWGLNKVLLLIWEFFMALPSGPDLGTLWHHSEQLTPVASLWRDTNATQVFLL